MAIDGEVWYYMYSPFFSGRSMGKKHCAHQLLYYAKHDTCHDPDARERVHNKNTMWCVKPTAVLHNIVILVCSMLFAHTAS